MLDANKENEFLEDKDFRKLITGKIAFDVQRNTPKNIFGSNRNSAKNELLSTPKLVFESTPNAKELSKAKHSLKQETLSAHWKKVKHCAGKEIGDKDVSACRLSV